jgi:peptidoglycan/xylan/chitin deacetylase (PgdA/CDA1 family)
MTVNPPNRPAMTHLVSDVDGTTAVRGVQTFTEYAGRPAWQGRLRAALRGRMLAALSSLRRATPGGDWIRFPYYHHVFDDERRGFEDHLRYMRSLGEFVSLDHAVTLLEEARPIRGRYLCVTFDDGFRNCLTNALPILVDAGAPAAFFLPTQFIGTCGPLPSLARNTRPVEFLTWEECRQMSAAGMTMGAHTVSHSRLITLTADEVAHEIAESKAVIETELGRTCDHFCAPWGRPDVDFVVARDPALAASAGFRSFAVTRRGSRHRRPDPMLIERDAFIAAMPLYELRYFLGR